MNVNKVVNIFKRPWLFVNYLSTTQMRMLLPDSIVLKSRYRDIFGRELNLHNPQTYNEKLQWLKLYDRNPDYSRLVDKYEVKNYVADRIGKKYVIPTYGVWDNANDIDFNELPNSFVLKATHDSHTIAICKNKDSFDVQNTILMLNGSLKNNYYYAAREWPYKNCKARIIAEKYMEDQTYHELRDYKFFCFNGEPKAMFIATERYNPNKPTAFDFFDMDFNHMPIIQGHPNAERIPEKPIHFERMKELARILSGGIPQVRVDFYEINEEVYFGEMTFFHFGGLVPFEPQDWDFVFGSWITLPQKANIYKKIQKRDRHVCLL